MPTAETIYEVPLMLEESGLGAYIAGHLGIHDRPTDLDEWRDLVERIKSPQPRGQGRARRQVRRSARLLHERSPNR